MLFRPTPSSSLVLLLAQVVLLTLNASAFVDHNANFPQAMALRAVVLTNTIPLAYYDEHTESPTIDRSFPHYHGFQPELLRHLQIIAKTLDNVTLSFDLEEAPAFSYTQQFEYLANNCNTTANRLSLEDCNRYDLVVGDYYGYPSRSIRTLLTPPILTTAAATVQYAHRQARQVSTLEEARALQEPVCLLKESHYDDQTVERFPGIHVEWCFNHTQCISLLKNEHCVLFVEDELQLRYMSVHDADLEVTREHFDEQYIVWPLRHSLDPLWQQLIIRWIYEAKVTGILDYLYHWYFSINYCPIGKAGVLCDLPCSPSKGLADRFGQCVCESIKWIGDDCSVEVMENKHLKSRAMAIVCYIMIGINFVNVAGCAIWMWVQRHTAQVTVAQPFFLGLVLLGCLVSTSTIFALGAQDEEDGPVRACMAIPWLYSVGFSITFGKKDDSDRLHSSMIHILSILYSSAFPQTFRHFIWKNPTRLPAVPGRCQYATYYGISPRNHPHYRVCIVRGYYNFDCLDLSGPYGMEPTNTYNGSIRKSFGERRALYIGTLDSVCRCHCGSSLCIDGCGVLSVLCSPKYPHGLFGKQISYNCHDIESTNLCYRRARFNNSWNRVGS